MPLLTLDALIAVTIILLNIYAAHVWPQSATSDRGTESPSEAEESEMFASAASALGSYSASARHPVQVIHEASEPQQVRDAQEFELEGLISSPSHARDNVHGDGSVDLPRDQFALHDDEDEDEGYGEPVPPQRKDYEGKQTEETSVFPRPT